MKGYINKRETANCSQRSHNPVSSKTLNEKSAVGHMDSSLLLFFQHSLKSIYLSNDSPKG
ncbi:MAG: hypothetical protein EBW14_17470 [Oxalobacteraceae bacterium]|nr:hypothetical protein [Oxalobacteraceae bacterium]